MKKLIKSRIFEIIGGVVTCILIIIFVNQPSFPTPDKLIVFMTFAAMMFGKAKSLLKRFVPFVALLLIYESFRGIADNLNDRVSYLWMPAVDRLLFFGHLPTRLLQDWLWSGQVRWYDFMLYAPYTLHFVMPFALGVLIWRTRDKQYWNFMTAFVVLSLMGFLTFLLFPAAPPWLANDMNLIEPIDRVSSFVWAAFGIHDFPTVYDKLSPNPVAAVPSLHAAYAFLVAFYLTKLYKSKWRLLSWIYPAFIIFGTVYMGEHYVIDAVLGVLYAYLAYRVAPLIVGGLRKAFMHAKLLSINKLKV